MQTSKKILIIGQAPPAQKQEVPYDSTMLYDWLHECGISKEKAQEMFEFEAVYNEFPGHKDGGGHHVPTFQQMCKHFAKTLVYKVSEADSIIILGSVAKNFLEKTPAWSSRVNKVLYLMHPSTMNYNRYNANKDKVLIPLKEFLCV